MLIYFTRTAMGLTRHSMTLPAITHNQHYTKYG